MIQVQRLLPWCFLAALSALWSGCDWALVSICHFNAEDPVCKVGADGMKPVTDMALPSPPDLNNVPVGPPAIFKNVAEVPLGQERKWAGIRNGGQIAFIKKNGGSYVFETVKISNNTLSPSYCSTMTDCPRDVKDFNFATDYVLVSNSLFYLVKVGNNGYAQKLNVMGASDGVIYPSSGGQPSDVFNYRPFVHPDLNVLIFQRKYEPSGATGSATTVYFKSESGDNTVTVHGRTDSPQTTYAFGNLDAVDPLKNGMEVLVFEGSNVADVVHAGPAILSDPQLLAALQNAITDASPLSATTPIDGAFIANLNGDAYVDLVFSRGGSVYATSYLGRGIAPKFQKWSSPLITVGASEKVKSISIANLNEEDKKLDIAIETDAKVYFYLNNM